MLVEILVLALATWRCASLLSHEDGPFEMFGHLRSWLGVRYDEHSIPYGNNWFAKGVLCLWCVSVWFGAFWAVSYFVWRDVWWIGLPFALSALAILWEETVNV